MHYVHNVVSEKKERKKSLINCIANEAMNTFCVITQSSTEISQLNVHTLFEQMESFPRLNYLHTLTKVIETDRSKATDTTDDYL